MDNYTEFLLERIFEIREDYKSGEFGREFYENVVGELVSCLSQYTVMNVDSGYLDSITNIISFPKQPTTMA